MEKSKNLKSEYKRCIKCNETKPVSEFSKNSVSKDGLYGYCKCCQREHGKQYKQANKHNDLYVVLDEIMPKSKSIYSIIGFLTGTIIVYII